MINHRAARAARAALLQVCLLFAINAPEAGKERHAMLR